MSKMVLSKLLQINSREKSGKPACYITTEVVLKLQANLLQIKNSGEECELCVPPNIWAQQQHYHMGLQGRFLFS